MYAELQRRIDRGETLLLDGAVGTELQRQGVPMDALAWAANALATHPEKVLDMHRRYLDLGTDIITTNTFSSARHNLDSAGLGDRTIELNRLAVELAQQARREAGAENRVAIAGSLSHFGILPGGEGDLARTAHEPVGARDEIDETSARANLREQAEILADAGVDLLLLESTGNMTQRRWLLEETDHLNLPRWLGYRCRLDSGDDTPRVGYGSEESFADGLKVLQQHKLEGIAIFHSLATDTTAALPVLRKHWDGLVIAYPEAEREDYTATLRDQSETANLAPEDLPDLFNAWIADGVQVVGGCCGIDADYFTGLKSKLKGTNHD